MVFIIKGKKRHGGVLVLHPGAEHLTVPIQHLRKSTSAVDHVGQCFGGY